jgi:hypothetical protein
MFWVTSRLLHFDRAASAWLISRFIDPDATFDFIEIGSDFPEGAITFSLAGGDIGRHDAEGTTFTKLLRRHNLTDPALLEVEKIVSAGVAHTMHGKNPGIDDRHAWVAVGLLAVAEGTMVIESNDHDILLRTLPVWDAVYVDAGMHLLRTHPPGNEGDSDALLSTKFNMAIGRHRHRVGRARARA